MQKEKVKITKERTNWKKNIVKGDQKIDVSAVFGAENLNHFINEDQLLSEKI